MMLLNSFVFACVVNSILSVSIGVFVYLKGKNRIINRVWGLFCLCFSFWSLGLGMMTISSTENMALFWLKYVHYLGAIFIPIVFLHVCLILLELHQKRKKLIIISYIIGGLLQIANFIGYLAEVKPLDPFKYYTQPGPLYLIFPILFFIYISYALYKVIEGFKLFSGFKKNQLKYFFIGSLIGFLGGATTFLPVFNLPLFPYGIYFTSLYIVIFAYAILRYHLMDIDIVIKQGTIYTIMVGFVAGAYIGIIFLSEYFLQRYVGYSSIIIRIVAAFMIAVTFLPIRNRVEKFIDRVFFREKIEYLQSLNDFSQSLITILDLRKLMGTIIKNITLIMKVDQVCLLFYDKKNKVYKLRAFEGFDNSMRKIRLSNLNRLILWLKNNKNIAVRDKLISENIDNTYMPVITQMQKLDAELAIPLFFNNNLIGILSMGGKNSKNIYSLEDMSLLKSLANQAAIAFSNALAYDDLKKLYLGTIEGFVKAIEAKDVYTKGHSERVVKIAVKIAIEMGLPRKGIELLQHAGVLHDIGKIGIDNSILNKQESLTELEYDEIKKHPAIGKAIVSSIKFLLETAKIILHHHERWDGKGYPDRLKNDEIPLFSRILCIADSYDSMTSDRPYRPAMSEKKAVSEIKKSAGSQFDPSLIKYFLTAYDKKFK